jgi:hypothetical protein
MSVNIIVSRKSASTANVRTVLKRKTKREVVVVVPWITIAAQCTNLTMNNN